MDGCYLYFDAHGEPFNGKRIIEQYEVICKLGQGGFGAVYKVRWKKDDTILAMKYINISHMGKCLI